MALSRKNQMLLEAAQSQLRTLSMYSLTIEDYIAGLRDLASLSSEVDMGIEPVAEQKIAFYSMLRLTGAKSVGDALERVARRHINPALMQDYITKQTFGSDVEILALHTGYPELSHTLDNMVNGYTTSRRSTEGLLSWHVTPK